MNELSLFTGAGGGILGTHLLGWRPIGYVEWDDYCQRVLAARITDGLIPSAPIFGDVRQFVQSGAAEQYRGFADVVTAGFPCQPFSSAGVKRSAADERNMWPATRDVIRIVRPPHVFLENVPGILRQYAAQVTFDLASMGYLGSSCVLSAASQGAPHRRERVWFKASLPANTNGREQKMVRHLARGWWVEELSKKYDPRHTENSSAPMAMDDGATYRMDMLRTVGQAQVPAVVAAAWELLA